MARWREAIVRSIFSGAMASAATAAAAAALGRMQTGSAVAPLNAPSHVLWGERAAQSEEASGKYTLTGVAINHAASMFWAALYERLFGRASSRMVAVAGAGAIAGLAYLVDYHLVSKRLTPGWEERLSPGALAGVFAALALALGASTVLRRGTRPFP